MKIKSLIQQYAQPLSWFFIILTIIGNIYQYQQYQSEKALEKEKQQAMQRLENTLQQSHKLFEQTTQKKAEIDKVNAQVKQCLDKAKPSVNECENLLAKSIELLNQFDTLGKDYEKLLASTKKDYCIIYPDSAQSNCQQVKK